MKTINFTDEELEHLRGYYQLQLEEAEKDVESIKTILSKLAITKSENTEAITEKKPVKRVRKPTVITVEVPTPEVKRGRKPKVQVEEVAKKARRSRSDKGSFRVKPIKPVYKEEDFPPVEPIIPEPIIPLVPEEIKPLPVASSSDSKSKTIKQSSIPKTKDGFKKKNSRPKRPRIILKNLSKPLPVKSSVVETFPPQEPVQEKSE